MEALVIEIDSGKIRGITENNVSGGTFVAFKGIPYAKSPIGSLRFRDPVPVDPWSGIKATATFGDACYQYDTHQQKFIGSEDCLYLNVYVPSLIPSSSRAVMVWIHGGGFTSGSGNDEIYGVDYLIEKDIIIVTVNYRLGCLGFLNLEHQVATGNQGLKDQIFALKWVQRNISKFGGNSNNVTVCGHSAGSASVHFLAVSPMGRGLFQKCILQSGVAINPWTQSASPRKNAMQLSALLGKKITNPEKLIEYLRSVEVDRLIEAQQRVLTTDETVKLVFPFLPGCDSISDDPFLPMSLEEIGKLPIQVPCIIGHVTEEFALFADLFPKMIGKNGEYALHPLTLEDLKVRNLSLEKVLKYYLGAEIFTPENLYEYIHLTSDTLIIAGVHELLRFQTKVSLHPTFFYKCSFDSEKTLLKRQVEIQVQGTSHGDELSFLFQNNALGEFNVEPLIFDHTHEPIIRIFTEMWTNFMKTGNPTPETTDIIPVLWEPVDNSQEYKYLNISDTLKMGTDKNYYACLAQEIGV